MCVRECVCSPLGLLVSVFEGVVCQGGLVASVLHHVVPCDQTLANGSASGLEPLDNTHTLIMFHNRQTHTLTLTHTGRWTFSPVRGQKSLADLGPEPPPGHTPRSAPCTPPAPPPANQLSALHSWGGRDDKTLVNHTVNQTNLLLDRKSVV